MADKKFRSQLEFCNEQRHSRKKMVFQVQRETRRLWSSCDF